MNRVALLIAVVIGAIPLSALAQFPARQRSGDADAWSEKKPFARLFITPDAQTPDAERTAPKPFELLPGRPNTAPPRVVCGMTIHQANPDVDPKILLKPGGGDVDYKLRSMTSPMCR